MSSGTRQAILIVDDNELNRDMLSRRLARQGYDTLTEEDGTRVMELLRERRVDLVLLDVMMPGVNGLDVLRLIRAEFAASELPVIMVTAKDESDDVVAALKLGANDYVTKPVDFPVALARVNTQLLLKGSQEQLRRTARELERSNRELKAFVTVVSHDLQEPLWKIRSAAEKLRDGVGDRLAGDDSDLMARLLASAAWMQTMFDGLLSYALVTGKEGRFGRVPLAKVMAQVLADLELRVQQTGGRVEVAGELPVIDADLLQMHQLLLNLVGNALKFHRPGIPPLVKVAARVLPPAKALGEERCELVIEDNGVGFDERQGGRIFKMFERLHDQDDYQGSGVGLAICLKIAEHHGGAIVVHSKPGEGTSFVVTLPAHQAAATGEAAPA